MMCEPFNQAVEMHRESEHNQTFDRYRHRLEVCDECHARDGMHCTANKSCGCTLVRWANRLTSYCPWRKW